MKEKFALTVSVMFVCLAILTGPAQADFKNFGIYQYTNGDGVLNPGDTFIDGFMSWYTYDSSGSSYNYGDHGDAAITGSSDLTGAPWASADANHNPLNWLRMDDDELHMYMAWSNWDNTSQEGIDNQRGGFALGMIANDYIRERTDLTGSGGYDLDIAIRNETGANATLPQVTLSDDYTVTNGATTGRPPFPGPKDNASQELYKITDPDGPNPYNHHFEGAWNYTASTADGGVIAGIRNGDYDIDITPSNIVDTITGDGLVIRIDPSRFTEVDKIIIYDFGYEIGLQDTLGSIAPAGYLGAGATFAGIGIEIPIIGNIEDGYQAFFIASIPEMTPEPSSLFFLLIAVGVVAIRRRSSRI